MRKSQSLILAALAVIALSAGCARNHVVRLYQKDGVTFSHYSDWKIIKDAPANGNASVRAIQIEGPNDAVVSLICEPPSATQTLDEFASAVASRRGAAIESRLSVGSIKTATVTKGSSESTSGTIAGQTRMGVLQQFSIDMLGTQVPHEARFFLVEGSQYRIMIMAQVAVSHVSETRQGADMILSSLSIDGIH